MSDLLVARVDDGPVAVLTLNRPEKRNAISRKLMAELERQLEQASRDPKVRSVVLTGAGKVFCAGMDLREAARERESAEPSQCCGPCPLPLREAARERESAEAEQHAVDTLQEMADLVQKLHTLPKPTIAALNGDALAGGAGLMAACDFAIASSKARIGYPEVLRGLVPAVVMYDLTRLLGDRRARQLLLTGSLIRASVALEWGLLNQVTEPEQCLAEAIRRGKDMVRAGPQAIASIKRLLDETEGRPKSLRGVAAVSAAIRVSEEAQEGIQAFLDKRPPAWTEPNP
ncbi:MAG: enoyl-CoA hydratase/isomerase family protein [Isosphaeraceae bacterium]